VTLGRRRRVLGVGIDAAEPTLVRTLLDRGDLPHLAALLEQGVWGRVASPAHIGSGTVWPTFITGQSPLAHGIHSSWPWDPARMSFSPLTVDHLTPFWKGAALAGHGVGILDVPFAPPVGVRKGFEIVEWGAHDAVRGRTEVSPPSLRELVSKTAGTHPFAIPPIDRWWNVDDAALGETVSGCLAGVRQRGSLAARLLAEMDPDLALVVFTEVHRALHLLWHTVDAAHPAHDRDGMGSSPRVRQGAIEILREVDRQIGRLVAARDAEDTVLVFSLHGMRATRGVVSILDPLLRAHKLAFRHSWKTASWRERAGRALGAAKRHTPPPLKWPYRRLASPATRIRLAGPTGTSRYDWSRTVAFPTPTDQHGWIRLNLAGREAGGILPAERYRETCSGLERMLRGLVTEGGVPVVSDVVRLGGIPGAGPPPLLPDLVVHWADEAAISPMRLKSPPISADLVWPHQTGQHAPDGFFLLRSRADGVGNLGASIEAKDLHRVLLDALRRG
jgi:predicted AlkP superfamily phosphohydrolase/phosphomutase